MAELPLVTIITATWGRPKTIFERCIPSVAAQDYEGPVEHLIVTDGRDGALEAALAAAGYSHGDDRRRLVSLGRNWSAPDVVHGGVGTIPRLVGTWLAAGELIGYCDDDNVLLPHHVSHLVKTLESSEADFACAAWHQGGPGGPVAGCSPPGRGRTDTSSVMHRASILPRGSWQIDGYESDGALVERWLAAGCTWVFTPVPTMILFPHRFGAPDE